MDLFEFRKNKKTGEPIIFIHWVLLAGLAVVIIILCGILNM